VFVRSLSQRSGAFARINTVSALVCPVIPLAAACGAVAAPSAQSACSTPPRRPLRHTSDQEVSDDAPVGGRPSSRLCIGARRCARRCLRISLPCSCSMGLSIGPCHRMHCCGICSRNGLLHGVVKPVRLHPPLCMQGEASPRFSDLPADIITDRIFALVDIHTRRTVRRLSVHSVPLLGWSLLKTRHLFAPGVCRHIGVAGMLKAQRFPHPASGCTLRVRCGSICCPWQAAALALWDCTARCAARHFLCAATTLLCVCSFAPPACGNTLEDAAYRCRLPSASASTGCWAVRPGPGAQCALTKCRGTSEAPCGSCAGFARITHTAMPACSCCTPVLLARRCFSLLTTHIACLTRPAHMMRALPMQSSGAWTWS